MRCRFLADRDQVGSGIAGQVAVETDPVDCSGVTLLVVVLRGSVSRCQIGSAEQLEIDLMEHLPELFGNLCALRRLHVLRREHKEMVQTDVRFANTLAR
jgi:hypothetical protein